jgi:hypothetical protein
MYLLVIAKHRTKCTVRKLKYNKNIFFITRLYNELCHELNNTDSDCHCLLGNEIGTKRYQIRLEAGRGRLVKDSTHIMQTLEVICTDRPIRANSRNEKLNTLFDYLQASKY